MRKSKGIGIGIVTALAAWALLLAARPLAARGDAAPRPGIVLVVSPGLRPVGLALTAAYGGRGSLDVATVSSPVAAVCGAATEVALTVAYPTDATLARPGCGDIESIPLAIGGFPIVYNVPGLARPLRLDAAIAASVYLGMIARWDDPAIARLNPGLSLPRAAIRGYHGAGRGDGDADLVVSRWLARRVATWPAAGGVATARWPIRDGAGAASPADARPELAPYSLGFASFDTAIAEHLQAASLQNGHGDYVLPSLYGFHRALEGTLQVGFPTSLRADLIGDDRAAFEPSYLLYVLVHGDVSRAGATGPAIKDLVAWLAPRQGTLGWVPMGYARFLCHPGLPGGDCGLIDVIDAKIAALQTG